MRSDTTLGDLNIHDRDNFTHLIKNKGRIFKFATQDQAIQFMSQCVDKCLRKCGVKIRPGMDAHRIDRLITSRKVKVEHREYLEESELKRAEIDGDEPRKTGFFIYQDHEIAGYISNPFYQKTKIDILPAYYVLTTVQEETVH